MDGSLVRNSVPKDLTVTSRNVLGHVLLLPMKNVHPPYRFMFTDLAEVDLRGFQILMSQDYL